MEDAEACPRQPDFVHRRLDHVIVEIKPVEALAPLHKKQLPAYLRLADKRLGLLINFHVVLIKDGITRIVYGLREESHAKPPIPQR